MFKTATALTLTAALSLPFAAMADSHSHDDHSHEDSHAHTHDEDIYNGYFEDSQIENRALSDWAGAWQSVFPLMTAGALAPVMEKKAAEGDKTVEEYTAYYTTGYTTDVDRIVIDGETVTFHQEDGSFSGTYEDDGYEILTYSKGNRGVRYIFEKVDGDAEAPDFIQFSDHKIFPTKADHYHLYWGDDRAAILEELTNWPTYYPADMSGDAIVAEMLAH